MTATRVPLMVVRLLPDVLQLQSFAMMATIVPLMVVHPLPDVQLRP